MGYDKPTEEDGGVSEPHIPYGNMAGKKVRIFNSFKDRKMK